MTLIYVKSILTDDDLSKIKRKTMGVKQSIEKQKKLFYLFLKFTLNSSFSSLCFLYTVIFLTFCLNLLLLRSSSKSTMFGSVQYILANVTLDWENFLWNLVHLSSGNPLNNWDVSLLVYSLCQRLFQPFLLKWRLHFGSH